MSRKTNQTGFAAVETVIVTPILILLFVIIVDFGRVMYYSISTASAARNAAAMGSRGATYATDTTLLTNLAQEDDFITDADSPISVTANSVCVCASPDNSNYDCALKSSCSDGFEMYVDVTVTRQFSTIIDYPTIPSPLTLSETATLRVE
ncbi:hypothetical protein JCM19231_3162 [Vibrio ishigakensis]|uniref:TadE-like domain-containing protein n=1 Tax=Vibrio ishigakensis TaxID=1481914 RepID=A0A0B8P154_9VIBR|nr:TadE family protein [Vibrio ishigakensis]GAM58312.1 hypothetical protein JCM19231_3162 [Vibrio ishigakensis]